MLAKSHGLKLCSKITSIVLYELCLCLCMQPSVQKMHLAKILLLFLLPSCLAEHVYYVRPTGSMVTPCPDTPCLPLDQYIQDNYFTTDSQFLFLPGNHSLNTSLSIRAAANISFRGNRSVVISCSQTITVDNVTGLNIQGLTFQLQLNMQKNLSSLLVFLHSRVVVISDSAFQGDNTNGASGRAINSTGSHISITNSHFEDNTGSDGGAITAQDGSVLNLSGNTFTRNQAAGYGGAIYAHDTTLSLRGNDLTGNTAGRGGGAVFCSECDIVTKGADENTFDGNSLIGGPGSMGGAMELRGGKVEINGPTRFTNNSAGRGGALHMTGVKAQLKKPTSLINNTASLYGGALYLSSTEINHKEGALLFSSNSATLGGAMYLIFGSTIVLQWFVEITMSKNHAREYGGAIYHKDFISSIQCENVSDILITAHIQSDATLVQTIPFSFLQMEVDVAGSSDLCPKITSYRNSAGKGGYFLYGGLLDRSKTKLLDVQNTFKLSYDYFVKGSPCNFNIIPDKDSTAETEISNSVISSEPYELKFCGGNLESGSVKVYRGEKFGLYVMAFGQGQSVVSTNISAQLSSTARLKLTQSSQFISGNCSELVYNLYTTEDQEEMTIYPKGPCEASGQASISVQVELQPCPYAFAKFEERCDCVERLKALGASCEIDNGVTIERHEGDTFWMNASYLADGSYEGLILSPSCPTEYCVTHSVSISLDQPDVQCAHNRSGVLCGQCAANFSLLLGGPQCARCSNTYLLFVLLFAVFGLALVAFLSLTRLTVAAGTINSLILYANLVQVNKTVFFPSGHINPLTVFVAWLNLDFGFQICFFDGMDAFARTLLQYVFPVYIWILVGIIVFASGYSSRLSKLVGPNPVAIMSTILLMSYGKILKVLADTLFYLSLEYPEKTAMVWAKDGNLAYLHSKHLLLFVIATLVLTLLFVPYTFFLLLGHLPLYHRLPHRKYYYWLVVKIRPILEPYYAPYGKNTRSWTGILLLVRWALYTMSSYDSIMNTEYSLLGIITVFSMVLLTMWLLKGLYRQIFPDMIEISVYMNLVVLSAVSLTLSGAARTILVYILVGVFSVTALVVVLYQVHVSHFVKTSLWLKLKMKFVRHNRDLPSPQVEEQAALVQPDKPAVSRTVINIKDIATD